MAEPPITVRASYSSFTAGDNAKPIRVVIHATNPGTGFPISSRAGTALDTAHYFASGKAGGSAHYVEDIASECHCVPDNTIAYHAPPNEHSIGIEICADGGAPSVAPKNYSRDQWLSPQCWPAVSRAAARTRELCDRFGIPTARLSVADLLAGKHGICGHVDVSQAWHDSDHSDPGPNFPWPEFMSAVLGAASAPATPTTATTHKRDAEPMRPVLIQYQPNGAFRGTTNNESAGSGSQVVQQTWLTFSVSYADPNPAARTRITVTSVTSGKVLDQKVYSLPNNGNDVYDPHPQARMVTIEGTTQPGGVVTADLVSLLK